MPAWLWHGGRLFLLVLVSPACVTPPPFSRLTAPRVLPRVYACGIISSFASILARHHVIQASACVGPYMARPHASTSHASQVFSGTFVLVILWHSCILHRAFRLDVFQRTLPWLSAPMQVCVFAGFTAVRPLEGRKGRPYSVHPLLELQDRFLCIRSPACTCVSVALHVA
jgi:hypothetical protein